MEITLISRYFDTRNGGAGSYSKLIYEGLKNQVLFRLPFCSISSVKIMSEVVSKMWFLS